MGTLNTSNQTSELPPQVAGVFYPRNPDTARKALSACFNARARGFESPYKALVIPHAGLRFSGPIAASGFASLERAHLKRIRRVVVLGPSHRMTFSGVAAPSVSKMKTVLGSLQIEASSLAQALKIPDVSVLDEAFIGEHAIEMLLLFVKQKMPNVSVVPLLVGQTSEQTLDDLLALLWGGEETLVLISSDLSHYHTYKAAQMIDKQTANHIDCLQAEAISAGMACGFRPLLALLRRARKLDLRPTRLDLRNSGDTQRANKEKVVGYTAYGFESARKAQTPDPLRRKLLEITRITLKHGLEKRQSPNVNVESFEHPLQNLRASFVTLEQNGRLRGCIGSLVPHRPFVLDVVTNTYKAAFEDPRFKPLSLEDLKQISVSISVLSTARKVAAPTKEALLERLQPDVDGLILKTPEKQGIFLPKVWESLPDANAFVDALLQKAGLDPKRWPKGIEAFTYSAELFS